MNQTLKLYTHIARLLLAIENCEKSGNVESRDTHRNAVEQLCKEHLPHGSGLDGKVELLPSSRPDCLVFSAEFHHMDESGFYDGWTEHRVRVVASLAFGVEVKVTGRDRNGIKDHLAETFRYAVCEKDVTL